MESDESVMVSSSSLAEGCVTEGPPNENMDVAAVAGPFVSFLVSCPVVPNENTGVEVENICTVEAVEGAPNNACEEANAEEGVDVDEDEKELKDKGPAGLLPNRLPKAPKAGLESCLLSSGFFAGCSCFLSTAQGFSSCVGLALKTKPRVSFSLVSSLRGGFESGLLVSPNPKSGVLLLPSFSVSAVEAAGVVAGFGGGRGTKHTVQVGEVSGFSVVQHAHFQPSCF